MSWLQNLLDSTEEMESPRSYFLWAGLSAISAIVKDNVWIERGKAFNTYPNIYVILYGASGLRKGQPTALARDIVSAVGNTRVISGRSSIESIIQELGTASTVEGKKGIILDSAGFIVSSEFSSSLVSNPMALTILTDLHDRQVNTGVWKNMLKSGVDKLKRPTITLFGGANEEQFRSIVTNKDAKGGFLGRTFVISETKMHKVNPLVDDLDNPPDPLKMAEDIRPITKLKGPFQWGEGAKETFKEWYGDVMMNGESDDTGSHSRIGDTVLKISMLLSLSVAPELYLGRSMVESAITLSEPLIPAAHRTSMGAGKSSFAEQTAVLLRTLYNAPNYTMSRIAVLKKHWRDFDAIDLDRMVLTLTDSRAIVVSKEEEGKLAYQLTPEAVDALSKMDKRKKK